MKIIIIDPRTETIIHIVSIYGQGDAQILTEMFKKWTLERGDLERIIVSGGTVRIMDPGDPVPSSKEILQ
jgi:hypothetical protein